MSWTVVTRDVFVTHVCRVIRFIPLQGWISIQISATPLEMGDGLLAAFKRRMFQLHIMLYDNFMDDIDYFIVKA
jgi:hypothetical protein